jgi:ribosomal protein S18 acetylase RimI-like enzyme
MEPTKKIFVEVVKKTKKNEPKIFPSILTIDREAFGKSNDQAFALKQFWNSGINRIIVARKSDTKAIVGYACFLEIDGGCYLMRIGVRVKS